METRWTQIRGGRWPRRHLRSSRLHLCSSVFRSSPPPSPRPNRQAIIPTKRRGCAVGYLPKPRRSIWMNGLQSEEPTEAQRREHADAFAARLGIAFDLPPVPRVEDLELRRPRINPPDALAEYCFTDTYERALHTKG